MKQILKQTKSTKEIATKDCSIVNCVVVGDRAVGKSHLICSRACGTRYKLPELVKIHMSAIWTTDEYRYNKEVIKRSYMNVDCASVCLRLWDTFGNHEKERDFAYKNADVIVLCYSVCDRRSLKNVENFWLCELAKLQKRNHQLPILLCACKIDLRYLYNDPEYVRLANNNFVNLLRETDIVYPTEGRSLASKIGAWYYETSVLSRYGVDDLFVNSCRAALNSRRRFKFFKFHLPKNVSDPQPQIPHLPGKPKSPAVWFDREENRVDRNDVGSKTATQPRPRTRSSSVNLFERSSSTGEALNYRMVLEIYEERKFFLDKTSSLKEGLDCLCALEDRLEEGADVLSTCSHPDDTKFNGPSECDAMNFLSYSFGNNFDNDPLCSYCTESSSFNNPNTIMDIGDKEPLRNQGTNSLSSKNPNSTTVKMNSDDKDIIRSRSTDSSSPNNLNSTTECIGSSDKDNLNCDYSNDTVTRIDSNDRDPVACDCTDSSSSNINPKCPSDRFAFIETMSSPNIGVAVHCEFTNMHEFSDVIFLVGNFRFKAHLVCLIVASPAFEFLADQKGSRIEGSRKNSQVTNNIEKKLHVKDALQTKHANADLVSAKKRTDAVSAEKRINSDLDCRKRTNADTVLTDERVIAEPVLTNERTNADLVSANERADPFSAEKRVNADSDCRKRTNADTVLTDERAIAEPVLTNERTNADLVSTSNIPETKHGRFCIKKINDSFARRTNAGKTDAWLFRNLEERDASWSLTCHSLTDMCRKNALARFARLNCGAQNRNRFLSECKLPSPFNHHEKRGNAVSLETDSGISRYLNTDNNRSSQIRIKGLSATIFEGKISECVNANSASNVKTKSCDKKVSGRSPDSETRSEVKTSNIFTVLGLMDNCREDFVESQLIVRVNLNLNPNMNICPKIFGYLLEYIYNLKLANVSARDCQCLRELAKRLEMNHLVEYLDLIVAKNEEYVTSCDLHRKFAIFKKNRIVDLLLERQMAADVKFVFDDGEIYSHKYLLSNCCDFMYVMFTSNFAEKSSKEIYFPSISKSAFIFVQRYLYTNEVIKTCDDWLGAIELANRLCLLDLLDEIQMNLIHDLISSSRKKEDLVYFVIHCLAYSNLYNLDRLDAWCLWYLSVNYVNIDDEEMQLIQLLPTSVHAHIISKKWPPEWYLKEVEIYNETIHQLNKRDKNCKKKERLIDLTFDIK